MPGQHRPFDPGREVLGGQNPGPGRRHRREQPVGVCSRLGQGEMGVGEVGTDVAAARVGILPQEEAIPEPGRCRPAPGGGQRGGA